MQDLGKMYRMYPSRLDIALDATGLIRLFPRRKARAHEFWALRNINLDIPKGQRLGIIGRNGAGKTTLLKLLTGNLAPTEGKVHVDGTVQALLTSGSGFHPEFTGYENIRSSLVYQGLDPDQIEVAVKDIAEFTELGGFLNQPFKLYSAGMQARLIFAAATVLKPDILIVDEILGAGDAYFFGKSIERMKDLVMSGATVLIVSHALDQISRFCESAMWMDRGKIVHYGTPMDVIAAYEEYTHKLEDRRLQARNRKRVTGESSASMSDAQSDILSITIHSAASTTQNNIDLSKVDIYEGAVLYESLSVGDTQDADTSQTMYLSLYSSVWSKPMKEGNVTFRRLRGEKEDVGEARCQLYIGNSNDDFSCEITYRASEACQVEICKKGRVIATHLLPSSLQWNTQRIALGSLSQSEVDSQKAHLAENKARIRRWPSEGSILIEDVYLVDSANRTRASFQVGSTMKVRLMLKAQKNEYYTIRPAITIARTDGIPITNLISNDLFSADLQSGQRFAFEFDFGKLNLGNGNYIISISIFRDRIVEEDRYDLIAHSHEFEITGNPDAIASYVFVHPGNWSLLL